MTVFICLGPSLPPPMPGCGQLLTTEERHYYATCCETCMQAWSDRMRAWEDGGSDPELDALYDAKPKPSEVN